VPPRRVVGALRVKRGELRAVHPRQHLPEELRAPRRGRRTADLRVRKRVLDPGARRFVHRAVLVERSLPVVLDVRLVPDFEPPPPDALGAVAADEMRDKRPAELAPPAQVLGRILPRAALVRLAPEVLAGSERRGRRLLRGQIPRHEAELDDRLAVVLGVHVIDLVRPAPVKRHPAVRELVVNVSGAPGRPGEAVAAGQRVVIPDRDRAAKHPPERVVQGPPPRRIRPVDLVVADTAPNRPERTGAPAEVDRYCRLIHEYVPFHRAVKVVML